MSCAWCGRPFEIGASHCECGAVVAAQMGSSGSVGPVRGIRGTSVAVVVLLILVGVTYTVIAGVCGWGITVIDSFVARPSLSGAENIRLFSGSLLATSVVGGAAFLVAAVVSLVWLFRARANAEAMTPALHRRAKPWLVFGWVTPVVALWFPKQLVDDIWRASHPDHPRDGSGLDAVGRSPVGYVWWSSFLGAQLVGFVGQLMARAEMNAARSSADPMVLLDALRSQLVAVVATCVLLVVAAVGFAVLVHRIGGFQQRWARGGDTVPTEDALPTVEA